MTTNLTEVASEKGVYIINAAFFDAQDDEVTPKTAAWTLSALDGTVINSRTSENIVSLDTDVDIVLSGNDLAYQTGESGKVYRILTIQGTYDSDEGSDMPLKDQCVFPIEDLKKVA